MESTSTITEPCPQNYYIEGLQFATEDEQKTVDFYLEIADQSRLSFVKEIFQRAVKDKQFESYTF